MSKTKTGDERNYESEISILTDMFGSKMSQEMLYNLLKDSESFDNVFESLLEFMQQNENFDFANEDIGEEELVFND